MAKRSLKKACICPCGRTLPLNEFPKRYGGYSRDGHINRCRQCFRAKIAEREKLNREAFLAEHGEIATKECGKCRTVLSVSKFDREAKKKDGYAPVCKECRKPAQKAYYERNSAAIKAKVKAWKVANPERSLATATQWQAENPEKVRQMKREWKARNPDHEKTPEVLKRRRDRRLELRLEAIATMGGKCECCGLSAPVAFLCFDHIGGWGKDHRAELKGKRLLVWLKVHGYPKGDGTICEACGEIHQGVRILCYSCNMAIAADPDGICPHQRTEPIDLSGCSEKERYQREYRAKSRETALLAYGGKCQCPGCGEDDLAFLSIEHVGGWGREHRREIKGPIYRWLKLHQYPKAGETCAYCGVIHDGFVAMCFNCNLSAGKSDSGQCPHSEQRQLLAA